MEEEIRRVLIVDDERALHAMLKPILCSHGFETISAMTGEEGLAMARDVCPDIIILDVIMPTMKGREVCRCLKSDPATAKIPVVFLTAKDSEDDVRAEMQAGAVAHITKPINPGVLVKTLKGVLGI
ncbi:MAG: response regulator [Elusimicrobia bacterium]|nr:response regulator [Elusimicrobiota bacterium]